MRTPSHRIAFSLAVLYLAVLAAIVFWPSPVDRPIDGTLGQVIGWLQAHGLPLWLVNYGTVEFSANVLMFVPFGVMAALRLPAKYWWTAAAIAAAVSGGIELAQGIFLPHRVASWMDVLANTSGGLLGALLVVSVRARIRHGSRALRTTARKVH